MKKQAKQTKTHSDAALKVAEQFLPDVTAHVLANTKKLADGQFTTAYGNHAFLAADKDELPGQIILAIAKGDVPPPAKSEPEAPAKKAAKETAPAHPTDLLTVGDKFHAEARELTVLKATTLGDMDIGDSARADHAKDGVVGQLICRSNGDMWSVFQHKDKFISSNMGEIAKKSKTFLRRIGLGDLVEAAAAVENEGKKAKKAPKPAGPKAGEPGSGIVAVVNGRRITKGKKSLFGYSVTSVLRAMGAAGITFQQAEVILTKRDCMIGSYRQQIEAGKEGREAWGALAPLTTDQLAELRKDAKGVKVEAEAAK